MSDPFSISRINLVLNIIKILVAIHQPYSTLINYPSLPPLQTPPTPQIPSQIITSPPQIVYSPITSILKPTKITCS